MFFGNAVEQLDFLHRVLAMAFFKDFIRAAIAICSSSVATNRCESSGMITHAPIHVPCEGSLSET
jgi:hypothetical protein